MFRMNTLPSQQKIANNCISKAKVGGSIVHNFLDILNFYLENVFKFYI